jgi:hypothetical protein
MSEPVLFPVMDPLEAAARRILCGEGRHLPVTLGGSPYELVFEQVSPDQGSPSLILPIESSGETSRMGIQFRPDGVMARRIPGGLPPGPDVLRKALLGVMCRELLDALARSTNLTLSIASSEPAGEKLYSFRFVMRPLGNSPTDPEAWGILELGEKLTRELIFAASSWPRSEGPLSRSLQLECPVVMASVTIPSGELLSIRPGDMLLLGGVESLIPEVRLPDGRRFKCPLPPRATSRDSLPQTVASHS